MFHVLLPHRDLAQEVPQYIVSEHAFPGGYFLRPNVLCFCIDVDSILIEGVRPLGPVLGNSYNTLPQGYEKSEGMIVLVQMMGGTWSRILGIDPSRFDRIQALDDTDCEGLCALHGALVENRGDLVEIAKLLDAFFLAKLAEGLERGLPERIRAEIIADLDAPLSTIARRVGVSERTLQRAFRERFGVSPSHFKRLTRLYRSRDQGHGLDINWQNVPIGLNFADQSHWIKEFKKLQGITPGEYRQQPLGVWHFHDRGESEPSISGTGELELSQQWQDHFKRGSSLFDLPCDHVARVNSKT